MKSIQKLLFTVVVTMGLNATQVFAEEAQLSNEQTSAALQIKELDQKISFIQAHIDDLDEKISLSKGKEKIKYVLQRKSLIQQKTDALIASKDVEILAQKAKTAEQDRIIASKDTQLKKENEKQAKMLKDQNIKIEELKAILK